MHSRQEASGEVHDAREDNPREPFAGDVLEMLEMRSSESLAAWLGERLGRMFPNARLRVLRVHPAAASRIKGLPAYAVVAIADPSQLEPPVPVGMDTVLLEALACRRALTIAAGEGGARMLVVLAAGNEARYLIELFGERPGDDEAARLSAFVAIAARYFERLAEAETDPLTRLANRRVFQSHLEAGWRRWRAESAQYYFAMLDIDHFKRVNDDFGHLYGDEILVHFANLMRHSFRAGDQIYRFGGEEFVLVFGADSDAGGERTLERFRDAVQAYDFPGIGRLTVSIGFTRIAEGATPATTLIDRADRALYYAKAHGRNRTCRWESLLQSGELDEAATVNREATLF